jgi:phosphoribosyl 1,2-cyclic phosphodiesterase
VFNDTVAILIDSGIPVKQVLEKTKRTKFDALFVSHSHGDHIKTAGALSRKTKTPIYMSAPEADHWKIKHPSDFDGCTLHDFTEVSAVTFGNITVRGFSTKHDSASSLGFIVEEPGTKFCYLTDTGSISKSMFQTIKDCDSYFIETDYDEDLMQTYQEYGQDIKDRITSNLGHLSTQQMLDLVDTLGVARVRKFIVGHLSSRTNNPEKVKERIAARFPAYVDKFTLAPFDGVITL